MLYEYWAGSFGRQKNQGMFLHNPVKVIISSVSLIETMEPLVEIRRLIARYEHKRPQDRDARNDDGTHARCL
jgi:hypothetical protein